MIVIDETKVIHSTSNISRNQVPLAAFSPLFWSLPIGWKLTSSLKSFFHKPLEMVTHYKSLLTAQTLTGKIESKLVAKANP